MRSQRTLATATLLAASIFGVGLASPAPQARAKTPADIAINGTYQADSIGGWAKINQQYNTEPEIKATWKISTSCTTMEDCTGTVTSDQGWTAPITLTDGTTWYVRRKTDLLVLSDESRDRPTATRVAAAERQRQDNRPQRCLRTKQVA
jgi:hypothetical protein